MKITYKRYSSSLFRHLLKYGSLVKLNLQNTSFWVRSVPEKVVIPILLGFILPILLFLSEHYFNLLYSIHYYSLPASITEILDAIPKPLYPDNLSAVVEFLSVIASVAGVILALFYPILATIISSAYSKTQTSIREIVLKEKSTQTFLKKLIFITVFSLTTLISLVLNIYPSTVTLVIILMYAFYVLYCLQKTGVGVYRLMETSALGRIIKDELAIVVNNVSFGSRYFDNVDYQNNMREKAAGLINNLGLLANINIKDSVTDEHTLKQNIRLLFSILQEYSVKKHLIPNDSNWFPSVKQYPTYYTSDSTDKKMARIANSFLNPKIKKDDLWFESKINDILFGLINAQYQNKSKILLEVISNSLSLMAFLGDRLDIRVATIYFNCFGEKIADIVSDANPTNYNTIDTEIQILTAFYNSSFYFNKYFTQKIETIRDTHIIDTYKKIVALKHKAHIYGLNEATDIRPSLLEVKEMIKMEYYSDGRQVTPDWYFIQKISAQYLYNISPKIEECTQNSMKRYSNMANLLSDKNPILTALIIHLGKNEIYKLSRSIDRIESAIDSLSQVKLTDEFVWKRPDFEKCRTDFTLFNNNQMYLLASILPGLAKIDRNDAYPDLYSESLMILQQRLMNTMSKNLSDDFEKTFASFLSGTLNGLPNIIKEAEQYSMPHVIYGRAFIDIMEISGYAYLFDLAHGNKNNELWNIVIKAWDEKFMCTVENVKLYSSLIQLERNPFLICEEKFEREQLFTQLILRNEMSYKDVADIYNVAQLFFPENNFHTYFSLNYSVAELFVELYLYSFVCARDAVNNNHHRTIYNEAFKITYESN